MDFGNIFLLYKDGSDLKNLFFKNTIITGRINKLINLI